MCGGEMKNAEIEYESGRQSIKSPWCLQKFIGKFFLVRSV